MSTSSTPKPVQPKKLPPPGRKADFKTARAEVLKKYDSTFRRLAQ